MRNSSDISKGLSELGICEFESSQVSQAVRGSQKMSLMVAERPANSGLLQFGVPSLYSQFPGTRANSGKVSDSHREYSRFQETAAGDPFRLALVAFDFTEGDGTPSFALVHLHEYYKQVSVTAFNLLEIDGASTYAACRFWRDASKQQAKSRDVIRYRDHNDGELAQIYAHAFKLGLEGIMANGRIGRAKSGRSRWRLRIKNSDSPAAKRADDGTF